MTTPQTTQSTPARLAAPLAGRYCQFAKGEAVKVKPCGGTYIVERAVWDGVMALCNILCNVPASRLKLEKPA